MKHPFEVGQTYGNRNGEYVVVQIEGADMTIRHADGRTQSVDMDTAARIWRNMQAEQRSAQPPVQRPAMPTAPPRTRRAPRRVG